mmetsp:Transcript_89158/g.230116  ORF Transcript_89158/g.230116 Transcript_89158/m.230116 type:complete len:254 (+) Transcript_89158:142-903(+)
MSCSASLRSLVACDARSKAGSSAEPISSRSDCTYDSETVFAPGAAASSRLIARCNLSWAPGSSMAKATRFKLELPSSVQPAAVAVGSSGLVAIWLATSVSRSLSRGMSHAACGSSFGGLAMRSVSAVAMPSAKATSVMSSMICSATSSSRSCRSSPPSTMHGSATAAMGSNVATSPVRPISRSPSAGLNEHCSASLLRILALSASSSTSSAVSMSAGATVSVRPRWRSGWAACVFVTLSSPLAPLPSPWRHFW